MLGKDLMYDLDSQIKESKEGKMMLMIVMMMQENKKKKK